MNARANPEALNAMTEAEASEPTVLCVDDEPNILASLRRCLRPEGWRILTAGCAADAMQVLQSESVDLVISDMCMPDMDGAQLLARVNEGWPDCVRLLLTGHADTSAAIAAINHGRIYRYLSKPWDEGELRSTVRQGLRMRTLERERARLEALTERQNAELRLDKEELERRVAERTDALAQANEALKRSYLTGIKAFSSLIEMRGGRLVGHGRRVAEHARRLAQAMTRPDEEVQQIFVAALLHDIGLISLPDALLGKSVSRYTAEEASHYQRHAELGEQALMPLQDMRGVAVLIRAHHERHDGQGFPDRLSGQAIPFGARILAVADAFDELLQAHVVDTPMSVQQARTLIRHGRGTQFDPEVVDVFLHITEPERTPALPGVALSSGQLLAGMVLARDLISPSTGSLMLAAGQVLNDVLIARIQDFDRKLQGKLVVYVRPRGAQG